MVGCVRAGEAGFATERKYAASDMAVEMPVENPVNTLKREGNVPEKITIPAIGVEAETLHL